MVSINLSADFGGFHFGSVSAYFVFVSTYFDWFQLILRGHSIFWPIQPIFQPICCFPTNFQLIREMVIKPDLIPTTSVFNSPMISLL